MSDLEVVLRVSIGLLGIVLFIVGCYLLAGQKNHETGAAFVTAGVIVAGLTISLSPITPWFAGMKPEVTVGLVLMSAGLLIVLVGYLLMIALSKKRMGMIPGAAVGLLGVLVGYIGVLIAGYSQGPH